MRIINISRPLSIPEQFAYANQGKSLSDNWSKLQRHLQRKIINDTFKVNRIHSRKLKNRINRQLKITKKMDFK